MAKKATSKGLGRGLSALLGDIQESAQEGEDSPVSAEAASLSPPPTTVPIEQLSGNPDQPRKDFAETELDELASSIKERGIIQPIVVRPDPNGSDGYQIVAGERRWRAAQRAQLHEVPVVVREFDDRTVLEIGIIENVQRKDLNPVEEALGYNLLIDSHGYTQDQLSRVVGKSRSHLANTMRLLNLPEAVQTMLRGGALSAGHARALINASDPVALAEEAVAKGLTVRQVERMARQVASPAGPVRTARPAGNKDADTLALEGDLSAAIGMPCSIDHRGDGGGDLRIRYGSLEDLDKICQKLGE